MSQTNKGIKSKGVKRKEKKSKKIKVTYKYTQLEDATRVNDVFDFIFSKILVN